ncbi:hypothetical protein Peur_008652 [Populus x canadensis]
MISSEVRECKRSGTCILIPAAFGSCMCEPLQKSGGSAGMAPSKARLDVIVYILAISVFKSKDGLVIFSAAGGVHCIKDLLLHRGWVWLVLNPSIIPPNQNGGHTSKPPQPSITLPVATAIHNLSK